MVFQFTHLTISGFKSFADSATIEIFAGLTGVVGPNGCGKSNVIDALRWVMGESNARSMRGDEMEDVIFAGTLTRPSRNLAEVSVTLVNAESLITPPFQAVPELKIIRKLERGRGSVYRINGRECRGRDVATLFADIGSGSRNSSIISQGQISGLIDARPSDRRVILEEAAGISGLHSRRHEAELKLRSAEQNLTRADDLRTQQAARLEDIRQQAQQAIRYRALSDGIRQAEAEYLMTERLIADTRRTTARIIQADAEAAVRDAQIERDRVNAEKSIQIEAMPDRRRNESLCRTKLERARLYFERIEEDIARKRSTRLAAEQRLATIEADVQAAEQEHEEISAAQARIIQEQMRLEVERSQIAVQHKDARFAVEQTAATRAAAETDHQAATAATARSAATHQAVELQLNRAREKTRLAHERALLASADYQRAVSELVTPERLSVLIAERDVTERALREAEQRRADAQQLSYTAELVKDAAAAHATNCRLASLTAETTLTALRVEFDALSAVMAQPFGHQDHSMLDMINAPLSLAHALGAALRDELAAGTNNDALRYWRKLEPFSGPRSDLSLANQVTGPVELQRALDNILLLPDDGDGCTLQLQLEVGQTLVSKDGSLWRWDGYVARSGAPTAVGVRLNQLNRLKQLDSEMAAAKISAAGHIHARNTADQAEKEARLAEKDARDAYKATETHVDQTRNTMRVITDAISRVSANMEQQAVREKAAADLCRRIEADLREATDDLAAVQAEFDSLPVERTLKIRVEKTEADLLMARRAETVAHQSFLRLNAESEQRDRRLNAIGPEIDDWDRRAQQTLSRVEDLSRRLESARSELMSLEYNEVGDISQQEARFRFDQAVVEHAAALSLLENHEKRCETLLNATQRAEEILIEKREGLILAQAKSREANIAWGTIAERMVERLGTSETVPSATILTEGTLQTARRRFEGLIRQREEMGPVNLRAEIEFGVIENQLKTIERECTEISAAISKLRGSIGHLNREGRERLSAIFTDVDRNFGVLFTRMFGGGRAHLALTGSDDPLASGLEIFAEPPGKRLTTLSLLSGGEQALTALSLIFAVFKCNPAPISVLDEVDAPLDDVNIERFCSLLSDIARETGTRFLVITHHHHTMARMDRLYGVTMQERGVSRVLSVDIEAATGNVPIGSTG